MAPAQIALWLVLGVALVISVVTDVARRRILDVVTLPALALGLGIRLVAMGPGDPVSGFLGGALGALLLFAVFGLLAWRKKMGWGDAKLSAAVGACLGLPLAAWALVFISVAGAVQALVTLLWQGAVIDTLAAAMRRGAQRLGLAAKGEQAQRRHIPYGVAIALGTFWAMWWDRGGISP